MSANPSILSYIREQMSSGFRKEQICEALLQAGWYKEEIDDAFGEIAERRYSKPEQEKAGKEKWGGRKKVLLAVAVVAAAAIVLLYFLGIFSPIFALFGAGYGAEQQGILAYDPLYSYGGGFSISLKNGLEKTITISSVSSDCGGASKIALETIEPTTLEPGASASYSTGDESCLGKEPGEKFSVSVSVRYLEGSDFLKTSVLRVEGAAL